MPKGTMVCDYDKHRGQCETELLTPLAHELLVTLVPGSGLVSEVYSGSGNDHRRPMSSKPESLIFSGIVMVAVWMCSCIRSAVSKKLDKKSWQNHLNLHTSHIWNVQRIQIERRLKSNLPSGFSGQNTAFTKDPNHAFVLLVPLKFLDCSGMGNMKKVTWAPTQELQVEVDVCIWMCMAPQAMWSYVKP